MGEENQLSAEADKVVEINDFGADPKLTTLRMLNQHTKLIRLMAKQVDAGQRTQAEVRQQTERMVAAMEEQMRAAGAGGAPKEWTPGGDEAASLRAYGTEDGGLDLVGAKRKVSYPDGSTEEEASPGFLTDPRPMTAQQQQIQRLYLDFALCYRLFKARMKSGSPWHAKPVRLAYRRLVRALNSYSGEIGKRLAAALARALSGGTGAGAEWILNPRLDGLIRPYDVASNFMARFRQKMAPAKTFDGPTVSGEVIFRRAGNVTTDDPSSFRPSTITTGSKTRTMKDLAGRVVVDKFWMDDMADLLDPAELTSQIRRGAARTLEASFINGDTAGTHQDTLSSWTVGGIYSAGAMDGSDSPLKQFLGLRALAADLSNTNDCGQTFSSTVAFAALESLGNRAASEELGWLTNLHVLHTQIMPNSNFLTIDKIGSDLATIVRGTMGTMLGRPVDVTQFLTNDLDATTGLYDGSGDSTSALLLVDYSAFDLWMLQEFTEFEVSEEHKGAVHLGATMRLGLETNCPATEKPVRVDFDL